MAGVDRADEKVELPVVIHKGKSLLFKALCKTNLNSGEDSDLISIQLPHPGELCQIGFHINRKWCTQVLLGCVCIGPVRVKVFRKADGRQSRLYGSPYLVLHRGIRVCGEERVKMKV